MPEFDRESGSKRVYDFILFFREAGWDVTFAPRQVVGRPDRYIRLLEKAGVVVQPAQGDDISELIRYGGFDLALLAFWHIGELYTPVIRVLSPRTKVVVDSVDLHFVRNARLAFVQPADDARPGLLDPSTSFEIVRELNAYAAADAALTVSEEEARLVNRLLGDQANASVVPDGEDLRLSTRSFGARQGLLFVGNFRHAPNIDAINYLCRDVLPRLPKAVWKAHPISVIGNGVNDDVRQAVAGLPGVRLIGWVRSLTPHLDKARVAVVPLRYGAGTKRKLIQSLMTGLPSVTTTVGAEGLGLEDGEHALIADDPDVFASAIVRLLKDRALWQRIASAGRTHATATRERDLARQKFSEMLTGVHATSRKRPLLADARPDEVRSWPDRRRGEPTNQYDTLIERIRIVVESTLPQHTCVVVVSKGDEKLLDLGNRRGWHFPQTTDGVYAGHYPRDGAAAIAYLETLREKGAQYLLLPATALWWLEYYKEFRRHLELRYRLVCDRVDTCRVYGLDEARADLQVVAAASLPDAGSSQRSAEAVAQAARAAFKRVKLGELRPQVVPIRRAYHRNSRARPRILVAGVYLADQPNTVEDTVARLAESRRHRVDQRWVALGSKRPSAKVKAVTVRRVDSPTPKFQIINELLADETLSNYEHVLLVDDDVVLPHAFVDHFISLQRHLGFALAQPARTSRSFIDHPIVEQQRGTVARQTRFVEIGPVVSFHRSIFEVVFPFDLTSPMGWGYENVWSARLTERKQTLGIIDAVPVDHSVRPPVSGYRWEDADRDRTALWHKYDAPSMEECLGVLRVFTASEMANA